MRRGWVHATSAYHSVASVRLARSVLGFRREWCTPMDSIISNINGRRVLLWQLLCLMSPLSCALDTTPDASALQERADGPVAGRSAALPERVVADPPRAAAGTSSPSMAAPPPPPPPPPPVAGAMPSVMMAAAGSVSTPPRAAAGSSAAGVPAQAGAAAPPPQDATDALQQLTLILTNRSAASPARLVETFEWLSATAACEVTARRQCELVCTLVGSGCAVCGGNHECAQAIARMCGNTADCD